MKFNMETIYIPHASVFDKRDMMFDWKETSNKSAIFGWVFAFFPFLFYQSYYQTTVLLNLSVNYLKTNRWMVCDFDIDIDLIEENGEWYVCYDIEYYAYLDEFTSRDDVKFEYSKKVKLIDIEKENFPFGV